MKTFNTEGPMDCLEHYCLPPLERIDLKVVLRLIDAKKYFLLHAPRQTGKTTCLLALMEYLNRQGSYRALYVNIESAQAAREDVVQGIAAVTDAIAGQARWFFGGRGSRSTGQPNPFAKEPSAGSGSVFTGLVRFVCKTDRSPVG